MESYSQAAQMFMDDIFHIVSNFSLQITIVTLLIVIIGYCAVRDYGVPPGPTGVPLLGYWPFLNNENCQNQLLAMKKKYGGIFSFRVTGKLYINLASPKVLKEAHITKSDCFAERTMDYTFLGKIFENGIVFSKGEKWQTIRKFFVHQFRERGMNIVKENTAEAMYENIASLVDELKENTDKPLDILPVLMGKSSYVIRQTLFGPGSPVSESDIKTFLGNYRHVMSVISSTNLVLIGSIARYLVTPFLPNYREALKSHAKAKEYITNVVENHKKTFDEDNVRDVIDSFFNERNMRKLKGDKTAEYFTDETLAANILQFVGDAIFNGSTFVTFFLKTLLDNPEEQEKIYKELTEVCGEDRNPGYEDKNKLTYTNAFLQEALRIVDFVPVFPSLECTRETTVGGYRIPKGAITLINIYCIHNDPQVYENPEKFDPSRFLVNNGKQKADAPITFGIGKRVCLGEGFVMMQAFLFCTAIVKNFRMSYFRPKSYYELNRTRSLEIILSSRK